MHAGTIYQHLKSNELFKTTPENALTDLSNGVHSTVFQPGQSIFTKNDVADAMYIIASGTVKIHDGEVVIATFGAGAFFGELSLLDSGLRSLSATAEEETELLQISRDAVFNIFKKDPKVLMNLVSEIVRRMRKQDEEMVGQLKSREKVLENLSLIHI